MSIKVYNTLTRKKEIFIPLKKKEVKIYQCGPTVYDFAHIGNLRTYIFEDILRRVFEYNGYNVIQAMNITDVGHLSGDGDEGEDKIELSAQKKNIHPLEIARFYEKKFFEDIKDLNILYPDLIKRATEMVPEQIEIIKILEKKGFTYKSEEAIYFDTQKFKNYGNLSGQKLNEKKKGAREEVVIDKNKKNPHDFVLWFFLKGKHKNHILHWSSPWGEGFPGWHIECSAISRHLLGQPFDVHCGGIDHIGTHHTNEIAQSEAAFDVPLANYWLHGEFLVLNKKKMAKSEGTFITLDNLKEKGFSPLAYRFFVLSAHYRQQLNFSWGALEAAEQGLKHLYNQARKIRVDNKNLRKINKEYKKKFIDAINDDLNTPKALAVAQKLLKSKQIDNNSKLASLLDFDNVLGLKIKEFIYQAKENIPKKILEMAEKRLKLREEKKWAEADKLREEISKLGYKIEDTEKGYLLEKQ